MSEYTISQIQPTDRRSLAQIDAMLKQEGILRDANLDYICAMYDEDYQIIGKTKIHLDEREVVADVLRKRRERA